MVRGDGTNAVGGEGVPEGLLSSPQARERMRRGAWMERVREVPEMATRANEAFVGLVREQPLVALGAACALGYMLGRVLRRVV
jgi:ElaB/YqjD/DUF883 family membrane-anchored ribosome-binding protein